MKLKYSRTFERFELTIRADHLEPASSALIGVQAGTPIFYDEISAVYRFRQPDWSAISVIVLLLFIFGLIGLAFYYGVGPLAGLVCWLGGLALAGYVAHRGFIRQKHIVRVFSSQGLLEFPCNNDVFFQTLLSHLNIIERQPEPAELRLPPDIKVS